MYAKRPWELLKCGRGNRTPWLNFINIKRTNFSYELCFGSFYYVHVTRTKLPNWRSYQKFPRLTLMKLTPWLNFITYQCKQHKFTPDIYTICYKKHCKYSVRRLIGSRIIESAAYCNQIMLFPLYLNSTQKTLVNWIIRLLLSILCWPKVILLSGGHCI